MNNILRYSLSINNASNTKATFMQTEHVKDRTFLRELLDDFFSALKFDKIIVNQIIFYNARLIAD